MKLLLKHLIRSIRKKPLQPIILILTLALSIATTAFAYTLEDTLAAEMNASQAAKYGSADFTVTLSSSSDSRFMFEKTAEEILDGKAEVAGCYQIPLIISGTGETAVGAACDFERLGNIFEIKFTEYGRITPSTLSGSALISQRMAEEQKIGVGDRIEVETLGAKKEYTVQGVSDIPFIGSYDMLVDITSIIDVFANNSSLFAAMGEDFKPCSTLFINITYTDNDPEVDEFAVCTELIEANEQFADKTISDVRNIELKKSAVGSLNTIIATAVALAALLSAVISFCCFYILANERAAENLSLTYAGAGGRMLAAMQYTEAAIYWIIAAPIGILLSIPAAKILSLFVGLSYTTVSLKPLTALKSTLLILAVCLLTSFFLTERSKKERRSGVQRKTDIRWVLCILAATVLLFVLVCTLPAIIRFEVYVLFIAATVILIFVATPLLIQSLSRAIDRSLSKSTRQSSIVLRYALKNISSLKLLHNISRLSTLIVLIVSTVSIVFASSAGLLNLIPRVVNADYAVMNATDRCRDKLEDCEGVGSVHKFYFSQASVTSILSADSIDAYSEVLDIDSVPKGDAAIVSYGIADMLSIEVGERFELEIEGKKRELVVEEIAMSGVNFIAIDCNHFGITYNMLLVRGEDGVASSKLLGEISEKTSSELAAVVSADTLLRPLADSTAMYMNAVLILLGVFILFSVIGTADTLYESLRARREEFGLYATAGLTKKSIALMKLYETGITLFFGIILGLIAFIPTVFATDRGMGSFSFQVILNLKNLFS